MLVHLWNVEMVQYRFEMNDINVNTVRLEGLRKASGGLRTRNTVLLFDVTDGSATFSCRVRLLRCSLLERLKALVSKTDCVSEFTLFKVAHRDNTANP